MTMAGRRRSAAWRREGRQAAASRKPRHGAPRVILFGGFIEAAMRENSRAEKLLARCTRIPIVTRGKAASATHLQL